MPNIFRNLVLYEDIRQQINFVFDSAVLRPKLAKAEEVMSTIQANQNEKYTPANPQLFKKKLFGKEFKRMEIPQHMGKLINYALSDLHFNTLTPLSLAKMLQKKVVSPYHSNLYKQFGERRVFNSPLDETVLALG